MGIDGYWIPLCPEILTKEVEAENNGQVVKLNLTLEGECERDSNQDSGGILI
jgi:hypothetical protein